MCVLIGTHFFYTIPPKSVFLLPNIVNHEKLSTVRIFILYP